MTPRQVVTKALHDQMCRAALSGEPCEPSRHSGAGYADSAKALVEALRDAGYELRRQA